MNILFHCWEYPPRGSGIGSYIGHLSKALRDRGHFTVIVTSHGREGSSEEQLDNGVIYRSYPVEDVGRLYIGSLIMQLVHQHRIDWIEGADHLGESSHLLSEKSRPPIFIKAHYNDVLKRSRYGHVHYRWQRIFIDISCLRNRARLKREENSLKFADVLISPCNKIVNEMREQGIDLPRERWILPNPISPLTGWANTEAQTPTILLVGRIDIGKGIAHLSRIISNLKKNFSDLKVEIAGSDSYARMLGSTRNWLVKQLGDNLRYVEFLGHLDQSGLDRAYSRAWVVIVPSQWDTFPTVVLESMIRRKALVASPNGGMPEMLNGTKNQIADPGKDDFSTLIGQLLTDNELRHEAGQSGHEKAVTVYNPEKIAEQYIEFSQKWLKG